MMTHYDDEDNGDGDDGDHDDDDDDDNGDDLFTGRLFFVETFLEILITMMLIMVEDNDHEDDDNDGDGLFTSRLFFGGGHLLFLFFVLWLWGLFRRDPSIYYEYVLYLHGTFVL